MIEEMTALNNSFFRNYFSCLNGKKTAGCKWVFIVKHKADGSIERY